MPQIKNSSRSKIPVAEKPLQSKKSQTENLKPEVKNKPRNKIKITKPVPAAPDGEKRRHLSVVDTNTREGSKSSVSDIEGEVFHTADKEEKKDERPKGGRIFYKSSKEKFINENPSEKIDKKSHRPKKVISDDTTTSSTPTEILNCLPEIKLEEDFRELLPEGVVNIEVDDGLYEYSREVVVYLRGMEIVNPIPSSWLTGSSKSSTI